MSLKKGYAVLKGVVVDSQPATGSSPHYQIKVVDDSTEYRISINVRSSKTPTDLGFILVPDFQHPILQALSNLQLGLTKLGPTKKARVDSGIALDFIRMNLFDRNQMKLLPPFLPGPDNDLNEKIDAYVNHVMGNENNRVYAFGEPWENENKRDKYFGFFPGNGIHDIHMNQGDLSGDYKTEDGVYQDGGLIFYIADENRYVAYFTKFQSQSWHTDDETGHALTGEGQPSTEPAPGEDAPAVPDPDHAVHIVAAMVNPRGPSPEQETVTLLNTTANQIDLGGWKLVDKAKNKMPLQGVLPAGGVVQFKVKAPVQLSNQGGIITLLNQNGLKIHGVSYTKAQARQEGETIVFS